MKKLVLLTTGFLAALFILSSCGKYEEGPSISLRSKKARVAGEWVYDKMLVDGEEQDLGTMADYVMSMEKDGTGTITDQDGNSMDVEWEFDDSKEKFRTRSKINDEWSDWGDYETILKLTNKEFWIKSESDDAGTTVTSEIHMKAK